MTADVVAHPNNMICYDWPVAIVFKPAVSAVTVIPQTSSQRSSSVKRKLDDGGSGDAGDTATTVVRKRRRLRRSNVVTSLALHSLLMEALMARCRSGLESSLNLRCAPAQVTCFCLYLFHTILISSLFYF